MPCLGRPWWLHEFSGTDRLISKANSMRVSSECPFEPPRGRDRQARGVRPECRRRRHPPASPPRPARRRGEEGENFVSDSSGLAAPSLTIPPPRGSWRRLFAESARWVEATHVIHKSRHRRKLQISGRTGKMVRSTGMPAFWVAPRTLAAWIERGASAWGSLMSVAGCRRWMPS
jgi:hypothetical protein